MRFNKPNYGYKSYHSAINGVANYIQNEERFRLKNNESGKFFSKLADLMIIYLSEKKLNFKNNKKFSSMDFNANIIQEDFKTFKKWLEDNKHLTFK